MVDMLAIYYWRKLYIYLIQADQMNINTIDMSGGIGLRIRMT